MKYPSINRQPMRTISIPELSGGLNMRDGVSAVNDNQLTECLNMWFNGGLLKTRPGLKELATVEYDNFTPATGSYNGMQFENEHITKVKDGAIYQLISVHSQWSGGFDMDGEPTINGARFRFIWVATKNNATFTEELPYITNFSEKTYISHFVIQQKDTLYCFCETDDGGDIYRLNDGDTAWTKLTDEDIYAPIIMTNCLPSGGMKTTTQELLDSGGVMFEGYNLLGNRCKRIWSTYNKNAASVTSDTDPTKRHFMYYTLLNNSYNFNGETITAQITGKDGEVYVHKVTIPEASRGWTMETTDPGDGLYMGVFREFVGFFTSTNTSDIAYVTEDDYIENNMVITEPCKNSTENLKKVFAMQRNVWFGGDAAGISGGTRVFLGGNTEVKERNLILWSGLNDPLYFPENCYAYVGNSNQAVTGFGQQSNMLVIFKERETYLTQYVKNSDITADDLINQNVVDYTASSVYFPIIHLHSTIGCDCPDTVQLCRNCLVWACTDGNVYTLRSENQFSERTIFKVSDMLGGALKGTELEKACSADVNGKYYLFTGTNVYVMDYESYGYVYISSYNKSEDAQLRIPWWYWELPADSNTRYYGVIPLIADNTLMLFSVKTESELISEYGLTFRVSAYEENTDCDFDGTAVKSKLTTKIFDFGAPAYAKNVPLVNIAFGNNGGAPVLVSFVSDKGDNGTEEVTLTDSADNERSPEYVHNRQLRPSAHGVTRFGVKLECDGVMSVAAMSLNYKTLGGARN